MALRLHALVGGTPAYLDMCGGVGPASRDDFDAWVVRSLLNPASAMFREGNVLLAAEEGIANTSTIRDQFLLLIGDAARAMSPVGGVGINLAVRREPQPELSGIVDHAQAVGARVAHVRGDGHDLNPGCIWKCNRLHLGSHSAPSAGGFWLPLLGGETRPPAHQSRPPLPRERTPPARSVVLDADQAKAPPCRWPRGTRPPRRHDDHEARPAANPLSRRCTLRPR